jgi:UDPglucose--hexose-1-phosphate uridylyltransferase
MARAGIRQEVQFSGFEDIRAGIVNWPMSVLRLQGNDTSRLVELADRILCAWRNYTDEAADILAFTDPEGRLCQAYYARLPEGVAPHNTITPIARCRDGLFELDLVLRNNRTTEEHPLGIFHPHAELHHIKKENIGLIEVMGRAILPARLKTELEAVRQWILDGMPDTDDEQITKHADWVRSFRGDYPDDADWETVLREETGKVFKEVLCQCAVYPMTEDGLCGFRAFLETVQG